MASQAVLDTVHDIMNQTAIVTSAAEGIDPYVSGEGVGMIRDLKSAAEKLLASALHLRTLVQVPEGGRSLTPKPPAGS